MILPRVCRWGSDRCITLGPGGLKEGSEAPPPFFFKVDLNWFKTKCPNEYGKCGDGGGGGRDGDGHMTNSLAPAYRNPLQRPCVQGTCCRRAAADCLVSKLAIKGDKRIREFNTHQQSCKTQNISDDVRYIIKILWP